jgi:hypothetical protein
MAIAFEQSSTAAIDNANTGSITTTASVGDVVLLSISQDADTGNTGITLPSRTWTTVFAPSQIGGLTHVSAVYYRVWTAGDVASPTDTINLGVGANERVLIISTTYSGVDTSSPIDSSNSREIATATANFLMPANFTPTQNNCMVVGFVAVEDGTAQATAFPATPSGATFGDRVNNTGGPPGGGAGSAAGIVFDYLQTTAVSQGANPQGTVNGGDTEFETYWIALAPDLTAVSITNISDTTLEIGQTGLVLTGSNFGAVTGTVEIGDSNNYGSATKVTQTVTNWNTNGQSITFNFVRDSGGTFLPQGALFVFVTNSGVTDQASIEVSFGRDSYLTSILNDPSSGREPDFLHPLSGNGLDAVGSGINAEGASGAGARTYSAGTGLCRDTSASFSPLAAGSIAQVDNNIYSNGSGIELGRRLVGGWYRFTEGQNQPRCIYEEGGSVNNLYMVLGFGARLLANFADSTPQFGGVNVSPQDNIGTQAISDFNLKPNRTYHFAVRYDLTLTTGNFYNLYIDGVKQVNDSIDVSPGVNDITDIDKLSAHTGTYGYGASPSLLQTGDVDITYDAAVNSLYNFWFSYCENGEGRTTGAIPTDTDLLNTIFRKGLITEDTVYTDTQINMQAAVESNIDDTVYGDVCGGVLVERVTGGGNFTLTMSNVTFDDRASVHVKFLGTAGETLTILNAGGGILQSKCIAPYGGSIVVNNTNNVTITGVENGSTIYVFDGPLPTDSTIAFTTSSSGDFSFSTNESSGTIVIITLTKGVIRRENVSFALNTIIPITQDDDLVYENPA